MIEYQQVCTPDLAKIVTEQAYNSIYNQAVIFVIFFSAATIWNTICRILYRKNKINIKQYLNWTEPSNMVQWVISFMMMGIVIVYIFFE